MLSIVGLKMSQFWLSALLLLLVKMLMLAGKGAVYSFDPVGSYERETYRAGGSAGAILQPLLDNQVGVNKTIIQFNLCECVIDMPYVFHF